MVTKKGTQPYGKTGEKAEKMTVEITCPNCNFSKKVPKDKIPTGVRYAYCPRCKKRFEFTPVRSDFDFDQAQKEEAKEELFTASPWEKRSELGILPGIYKTFISVLFSPREFFSNMTSDGGIREPMAFGLLFGSLGTMFGIFWQFLIMSGRILTISNFLPDSYSINLLFLGIIIISPLFVLLNMFITGGIIHLCLLIVRGGRSGFKGTFRVVAFSQSTKVLSFVPLIGGLIGWFWHVIVLIIGIRKIHKNTYLRSVFAVLITLILKGIMLLPFYILQSIIRHYQIFS